MAKMPVWIEVPLELFRGVSERILFDLYLRLGDEHYTKVFSHESGIDFTRLFELRRKGVRSLFIDEKDEEALTLYFDQSLLRQIERPGISSDQQLKLLAQLTDQAMLEIVRQGFISPASLGLVQGTVAGLVKVLAQETELLVRLLKMIQRDDWLYFHQTAVTVMTLYLAKITGIFSSSELEGLGTGAFLHDIGLLALEDPSLELQLVDPSVSSELSKHPQLGLDALRDVSQQVPDSVRYIVYQHHERLDGSGYPNQLVKGNLYEPALLVGLVDEFITLIQPNPFRAPLTTLEAKTVLEAKREQFPSAFFEPLMSLLQSKWK